VDAHGDADLAFRDAWITIDVEVLFGQLVNDVVGPLGREAVTEPRTTIAA